MNDYSWFSSYPEETSRSIDPDKYSSIVELLKESIGKFRSTPAFENMGKQMSFEEVDALSDNFAAYLQNDLGLVKGDRIAIQMPNLLQYPVALFGALKAGLIVVNTNPLYTAREMKHQFNDSGAKAIVILANFGFNLEKIVKETGIQHIVTTEIGDMMGGFKRVLVNFVVKRIKKMVPAYSLPGAIKFNHALKKGAGSKVTTPEISNSDVALLQYTGGTTGVSKGATLTHRNIVANVLQCQQWFYKADIGKETIITALPLYHIFAFTVNCLFAFSYGMKSILITNPRDMPGFIKELKKHPFSIFTGVNTLYNGLLNQPNFKEIDFSHLKVSVGGGMAVQKVIAEKWKSETGCTLIEGYGLSETSPVLTCNPLNGKDEIGTIGIPVPNTEVVVMDETGKEVPHGEPGEICAKGPQVFSGYWERKEESDQVFFGDFFRTGDIGIQNDEGFFKIVDRKKDMILVSGFNVFPNEVEDVLMEHPKVLEVACVGVPDEKSTEAVKIFVVKRDSSLTEHELHTYCKDNLTAYKKPKYIEFREELPKTNVGKILRRVLKDEGAPA